jgi:Family of unknown function (DUF5681)
VSHFSTIAKQIVKQCGINMPFKPGQSGNPKGRPKGRTYRGSLRAELSKPTLEDPSEIGYEVWARKIIDQAEAAGWESMLEVIKFLEGASPSNKDLPEDLDYAEACDEYGNPVEP